MLGWFHKVPTAAMRNVLHHIINAKRQEVAQAKQREPISQIKIRAENTDPPRNFFSAVMQPSRQLRVIAEVKRASPSAGVIRHDFDPVVIARAYYANGAAAISCLTDEKYFQGKLSYIDQVKREIPLPVLRKDFIIDPYQLYEARAAGADAVLLIAECLDEVQLVDLLVLSRELQMTTLVEVFEVKNLLKVRPHIGFPHPQHTLLGINNRDLRTMETDVNHTLRLLEMVDDPEIVVSESGIRSHDDAKRLMRAGVFRILAGEHLMRQSDVGVALRNLIHGVG